MKNIISILFLMLSFMSLAQSQSITVTYRYDDLHRLDRATYSNGIVINYTYDALGNRTSYVVTGACALATPSVSKQDATCGNTNGSLTVTTTGSGLQYSKDGTTFQPSNVFNNLAAGTYTITVKDAANCTATATPVTIQNVGSNISITSVTPQNATCGNANGRLTVVAVGSNLQYAINGGVYQPSPVFSNLTVGSYTVIIKDANSCPLNAIPQRIENVGLLPVASFTNAATNLNVVFSNTSTNTTGATYSWNFGDNTPLSTEANPTHLYAQSGSFTVTLTITTACGTNTTTRNITVSQGCLPPFAGFTNVVTNLNVVFSNTSTNTTGATYSWNFGDNTPLSTNANPTHLYTQSGTFIVTLTITTACGTNTTTRNVTVSQGCLPPVAAFTTTMNGLTVVFTNTSTNGLMYNWTFGNGQTSTAQNPSITFTNAGTYMACLTVSNGCSSRQICQEVSVSCAIANVAISGNSAICQGSNTTLTASGGTAYVWSNGATTPSINVATGGNYTVTATNTNGCLGTTNLNIIINPRPKADFGFNIQGGKSQFVSLSTDTNNTTVYRWDLGNGTTSNLKNPIGNYSANGNYTICLWVTNGTGCKDSVCKQINVTRVAVQDLPEGLKVKVSPNPTSSTMEVTINYDKAFQAKDKLVLIDLFGRQVAEWQQIKSSNSFDISHLANRTYLLRLTLNGKNYTLDKIVKTN